MRVQWSFYQNNICIKCYNTILKQERSTDCALQVFNFHFFFFFCCVFGTVMWWCLWRYFPWTINHRNTQWDNTDLLPSVNPVPWTNYSPCAVTTPASQEITQNLQNERNINWYNFFFFFAINDHIFPSTKRGTCSAYLSRLLWAGGWLYWSLSHANGNSDNISRRKSDHVMCICFWLWPWMVDSL